MLKLYKDLDGSLSYWEAWADEGKVVIHWGVVGTLGESRDVMLRSGDNAEELIERESRAHRENGFEERDCLAELVIQYKCDGWGSPDDLRKRYRVEDIMNEALGWTGNGHCDGGDIGSGTINIFCYVVEPYLATETVRDALRESDLLEGAIIAVKQTEDGDYKISWPHNLLGQDFSY